MLLVTFHGGSSSAGINNVFVYGTGGTDNQSLLSPAALAPPPTGTLSELRSMVVANGDLYVANGGKSTSNVLCYALPPIMLTPPLGLRFTYASTLIAAELNNKGDFETATAHPFGLAFDGSDLCYISNQDTNVVAQLSNGSLGSGCQSAYLSKHYPPPDAFLDGTYVASRKGHLHHVTVEAPDVSDKHGGLGVKLDGDKVQNSVRDVAIANGILFVCDEADSLVNMYSLADGNFIGPSNTTSAGPTHLAMCNGGLYVSAGQALYWSQLPSSATGASLSLSPIALTPPNSDKIGGISFDGTTVPATVYIPFQAGTGGANGGSIYSYAVAQSSPSTLPVLSNGSLFVASGSSTFADTPEFVLYLPG